MDAPPEPERIGPYTLLEVLGEGGMGIVHRAEQAAPIRRQVALKVIKLGMDTAQVVARFEAERQALAVMDHPSIARIYDGGATEAGRPYFVMELVEGEDITVFCDRHRLSLRERVRLFVDVCRAVQHAHQKGVIHRDLKPSNILVSRADGVPLPKIIDFGIARAVAEPGEDGTRLTEAGQVVGTPAYMAPEQIDGPATGVDTRVDVYALGMILYELLAGVLPFDLDGLRSVAAYARVLDPDRPRPSTRVARLGEDAVTTASSRRVDRRTLVRQLRGDLDWIVQKAAAAEPDDRYETANGLAVELERYLAQEPVLAGPPSTWYRAGKFVRRHRTGVAFAAMAVVALAGFGVVQAVQAERIREARDLADARREQAEGALDFMLSDLRAELEPLGRLDILDGVGRQAMRYFATLPEDEFSENELLSRSQALYQIGAVRLEQGDLPAADSAFRESLRLAGALHERDPSDSDWLYGVGQAEFWAGELARRRGDLATALAHMERYRDLSVELSTRDPSNLSWLLEVGYGHTNLGVLRLQRGDLQGAAEAMERSLEVKVRVAEATGGDPARRYDLARGYFNLARVQGDLGRLGEAAANLERDIAIKDSLLADDPENAVWLATRADSDVSLGEVLLATGRVQRALEPFERGHATARELARRDPANTRRVHALAVSAGWLARAAELSGDRDRALSLRAEAVRVLEDLVVANPGQPEIARNLAGERAALAEARLAAGPPGVAREEVALAVAVLDSLREEAGGGDAVERALALALVREGRVLAATGDEDGARASWTRAVELLTPTARGSSDPAVLDRLSTAMIMLDRTDEASAWVGRLRKMGYADPTWAALVKARGL